MVFFPPLQHLVLASISCMHIPRRITLSGCSLVFLLLLFCSGLYPNVSIKTMSQIAGFFVPSTRFVSFSIPLYYVFSADTERNPS